MICSIRNWDKMKYSIIIPVRNAENTIERCVNSIISQRGSDIQILLIENCSTDDSKRKCELLADKYENVELYISSEIGVSNARNIGLSRATGDIIGFCDADDYYAEDTFDYVDHCFNKSDIDALFAGYYFDNENETIEISPKKKEIVSASKAIEYVLCNTSIIGSVCNKFYKREMLKGVMFPKSLSHFEDGYFNIFILANDRRAKIQISTKLVYHYVYNDKSVTVDIEKLFDENCNLKYLVALKEISNIGRLSRKEVGFTKSASCRMAINTIHENMVMTNSKYYNNMYESVKSGIVYLLLNESKYQFKDTLRLFLIGTRIIIKGKHY